MVRDGSTKRIAMARIAAWIAVGIALTGCQFSDSGRNCLPFRHRHQPIHRVASLELWLSERPTPFAISQTTTLRQVLSSTEVVGHRQTIGLASSSLENFKPDNCIVLARGNTLWYFIDPIEYSELYAGQVTLRSGDKIATMPLEQTVFRSEGSPQVQEYLVINTDGSIEQVQGGGPKQWIGYYLRASNELPEQPQWTTTTITRVTGPLVNILVLPSNASHLQPVVKSIQSALINSDASNHSPLLSGDIVTKTNMTDLALLARSSTQ